MSIELYVFPPSPRAFKVLAVANHLGVDYMIRLIDLTKGDQRQPDYAALNPNMRMPTLKEGDYILWESNAICQYLAAKRPDSGLLPSDRTDCINVTRWQFWDLAHWDPACVPFIFQNLVKRILGLGEPDPAAVAAAEEPFHRVAKVLDSQLRGRRYVTGDTLTLADFSLGAAMNLAEMVHFPTGPYADIKRWHAGLCELPAWRRTLEQTTQPIGKAA